jgi:hypothetical protein
VADTESGEKEPSGGRATLIALAARRVQPSQRLPVQSPLVQPPQGTAGPVSFDRRELNQILAVYGRRVAEGEWRDYAVDHLRDSAVFSIFRRASETPLYRIVKQPRLARRQGAYSLVAPGGMILKRGHDLANILRVIDRPLKLVVA